MTRLESLLGGALKRVEPLMNAADKRRRLSLTHPKRAVESDLKAALRHLVGPLAGEAGLRLNETERGISPPEWPRLGPVDLVLTNLATGPAEGRAAAFMELKWTHSDGLWYLAWDLAKSLLVDRLRLADRALCVVGALDSERATRYSSLLEGGERGTAQFLRDFHSAMKPFCFSEAGREHPTGPYRLPAAMQIGVLCEQPLRVRSLPWTLTVLEVRASGEEWVAVDELGWPV